MESVKRAAFQSIGTFVCLALVLLLRDGSRQEELSKHDQQNNNRSRHRMTKEALSGSEASALPHHDIISGSGSGSGTKDQYPKTHVAVMSNRDVASSVVLDTTCKNTNVANLVIHVITDSVESFRSMFERLESCEGAEMEIQTIDQVMGELKVRGYDLEWTNDNVEGRWGLTTPFTDIKHSDPLNLVRFYLPHLSSFAKVDFIVFLDDDIIVQDDVSTLTRVDLGVDKAIAAGCQHWQWSPNSPGRFKSTTYVSMRDIGYVGNFDHPCEDKEDEGPCTRPGLMDELINVAEKVNGERRGFGRNPLENHAFNMGLNVIDTAMWKTLGLTRRFERWVEASYDDRLFAPDTLAFGLGLAYLALGDAVQCYDTDLVHLVGLAFVDMESLEAEGWTTKRMRSEAFALHYNGANKPWNVPMPECGGEEEVVIRTAPEQPHQIWQHACVESGICACRSADEVQDDVDSSRELLLRGEGRTGGEEYTGV